LPGSGEPLSPAPSIGGRALERDVPGLDDSIAAGEFQAVHDWLEGHVHRHGQRYETNELVERATGEPITAEPLLGCAEAKSTDCYER